MRRIDPFLIAACLLTLGGAARAQSDGPVATAGGGGGAPTATDLGPSPVRETPAAPMVQPSRNISDLEVAADHGRRAPLLGEYHGQVGAVVGTNGLRGAYGRIVAHPTDNASVDLRFSTIRQNGYGGFGYGGFGYDRRDRYRPDLQSLSPDPLLPPGY